MDLTELKCGQTAVVLTTECEGELAGRLSAFGFLPGEEVTVLKVSPFKRTYLIRARGGQIVLAREAAKTVRVWPK